MNHATHQVSLPLSPCSKTYSAARRLAWTVGFALCLLASSGLWAAVGGGADCENCKIFAGSWDCQTGGAKGGSDCDVSDDGSCTVTGNCNSKSHAPILLVEVPLELIQEVAGVDGGAAATLVRLREMQILHEDVQMGWLSSDITPQDVASLLAGGELGAKTPGQVSRFDIQVVVLDGDNAALVMQPSVDSDAQDFNEMAVFFERDPGTGRHLAKTWLLH